jgi:ABC-type glycerol-3-phosphate transport system permease component
LNPSNGLVNQILAAVGIDGPGWFFDPAWAKNGLVLLMVWAAGDVVIIYLAALQGVSKALYDAAEVDGAGAWVKLRHVTIPMISPAILFNLIVGAIGAFQYFTQAYVIGNGVARVYQRRVHRWRPELAPHVRAPPVQQRLPLLPDGLCLRAGLAAAPHDPRRDGRAPLGVAEARLLRERAVSAVAISPSMARSQRQAVIRTLIRIAPIVVLVILAATYLTPFVWMVSTSLKTQADSIASPPVLIPKTITTDAFPLAFVRMDFLRGLANTLIYAIPSVIGTVVSCSLVAYGFALVHWRGRNIVFVIVLVTMMLPSQVTLIPLYVIYAKLGWINTYLPLVVPTFFGTPFFIFLLRQFFLGDPARAARRRASRWRQRAADPHPDRRAAGHPGADHRRPADLHRQVERLLRSPAVPAEAGAAAAVAVHPGLPVRPSDRLAPDDGRLDPRRRPARADLFLRPAQVHRGDHVDRNEGVTAGRP